MAKRIGNYKNVPHKEVRNTDKKPSKGCIFIAPVKKDSDFMKPLVITGDVIEVKRSEFHKTHI